MFEPRVIKAKDAGTIVAFTELNSSFESTVYLFNVTEGTEVAQIKGAQCLLIQKNLDQEQQDSKVTFLMLADPTFYHALHAEMPHCDRHEFA